MKRVILFIAILCVPLGFFIAAWQAYSWQQLTRELENKDMRQKELLENNKRLLALLAQEESPALVVERAQKELGMTWPIQEQIRILKISPSGGANGSQ